MAALKAAKAKFPQQASTATQKTSRIIRITITRRGYGTKAGHGVKVFRGFRGSKWIEFNVKEGQATLPLIVLLPPGAAVDPSLPRDKRKVLVVNVCDHRDHLGETSIVLPKEAKVLGPITIGSVIAQSPVSADQPSTTALWDFSLQPGGMACCGELFAWESGAIEYYWPIIVE